MRKIPAIKAVMTPFPHSVDIDDPVARAREIMRRYDMLHVPVEEAGRLVGIATHLDIAIPPKTEAAQTNSLRVDRQRLQ